jgi:ElaB/YqjD/DUF883 family membrane-anchored ribosome-binding protein
MTETYPPAGGSISDEQKKDPAEIARIEAEIDQTRSAISGDLRTLGERLSPQHLKEEAKEVMSEAKNVAVETLHEAKNVATSTFREVKNDALDSVSAKVDEIREDVRAVEHEAIDFVRENAVPLALIGIGVAWFVSKRRSRDERWEGRYAPREHGRWRYPTQEPTERGTDRLDEARNGLTRAADTTREYGARAKHRARDWVDGAERQVGDAAGQVRDFAEREMEEARGMARNASQKLSRVANQARDSAGRELRQARELTRRTTESHPLAVAAGAVAAGVFVGLVIPETRRESQLLGPERERLVDDAKEAVQGLAHTAKQTARDVKNSLSGTTG